MTTHQEKVTAAVEEVLKAAENYALYNRNSRVGAAGRDLVHAVDSLLKSQIPDPVTVFISDEEFEALNDPLGGMLCVKPEFDDGAETGWEAVVTFKRRVR